MTAEKNKLFQDIAAQLQLAHNLSPLGAQILGYLILDISDDGVSFDDMVKLFRASKSSISTNLQLLLQLNFIEAVGKMGSRKRYFRLNRGHYIELRLQQVADFLEREHSLTERYVEYAEGSGITEVHRQRLNIYLNHLKCLIGNLENTMSQLKSLH